MRSIHDPRYHLITAALKEIREKKGLTQDELAANLGKKQSYVSKAEGNERRLDLLELSEWLIGLGITLKDFLQNIGWLSEELSVAVPIKGQASQQGKDVVQKMLLQGKSYDVVLKNVALDKYLEVEEFISNKFLALNEPKNKQKNREAIFEAIEFAVKKLPKLNPSDIYVHLVYRAYIRDYKRTRAEQSWVRAGGEAMEIFVEKHYSKLLAAEGITIKALLSGAEKAKALKEMGLEGVVGDSKLDIALYGTHKGKQVIFGGIHSKASLAERVSDDVPCSVAMMGLGLQSILLTFDAKSYPPPQGNLVTIGEFGTTDNPSDKRHYIESHGSFDVCFSYNLHTYPSKLPTKSGKQIYVSDFGPDDPLPQFIIDGWKAFKAKL
ncbi:BsaWI family type II restriction enzyme [Hymenobacter mucosus]|uniref:Helix-turn-helix n=1 Tax=Hymenobacter mucosus TaxID=1411120 RepID=A0A239BHE5_9BACT|nr:BsaWI family type II restriction enzyme [Hymenobacter mucosus]SNS07380.1 Helix-turn-helix [Hymenobacter mucosus]